MDSVVSITESVSKASCLPLLLIGCFCAEEKEWGWGGRGGVGGGFNNIQQHLFMTSWMAKNEARKESTQRHRAFCNHLITLLQRAVGLAEQEVGERGGGDSYSLSWKRCLNAHFRCRSEKYETKENETQ